MTEVHCTGHVDYDPKKTVKVQITERVSYIAEVEMTESEYKDSPLPVLCKQEKEGSIIF